MAFWCLLITVLAYDSQSTYLLVANSATWECKLETGKSLAARDKQTK